MMMMTSPSGRARSAVPLGSSDLRARRIRVAIAELRRLDAAGGGATPEALGQALAAFAEELARVEGELDVEEDR